MKTLKVNIGCGMSPTRGWENFDNSISLKLAARPFLTNLLRGLKFISSSQLDYIAFCRDNKIRWADATRHIPLQNNSVAVIYSSHMLEHLDRGEARSFLKEAKRILQPGGTIRLSVPDLAKAVGNYISNKDADEFMRSMLVCQPNAKSILSRLRLAIVGNRHHLWMYDKQSLSKLLEECGFENPKSLSPGDTSIDQPGDLNLREREDESI